MADKYLKVQDGNSNLFEDSDDDDDDDDVDNGFLSQPRPRASGYIFGDRDKRFESDKVSKQQRQLMDEIERIEKRTLESTQRSLGLVCDSEKIAIGTAEDLMHQREQLENCDAKVTNISRSLRDTQKHINSIKSVFSNFRSIFSKTPESSQSVPLMDQRPERGTSSSSLVRTIKEAKTQPSYQVLDHPESEVRDPTTSADVRTQSDTSVQKQLDNNLGELSIGIERLKVLALELGDEINDQNALLDELGPKVERAEGGIKRQNAQLQKLLKK